MEDRKECFGRWVIEDIGCMTCKDESACSSSRNQKERNYYLDNKLKRDPECKGCIELSCGGKCNRTPEGCFGDYGVDGECPSCRCTDHCFEITMKNEGIQVIVKCKNTIRCLAYIEYHHNKEDVLFNKDETYDLIEFNGHLYKNDILLFKDYEENNIFHNYFSIMGYVRQDVD